MWIGTRTPATLASAEATTVATPAAASAATAATVAAEAAGKQSEAAGQVARQLRQLRVRTPFLDGVVRASQAVAAPGGATTGAAATTPEERCIRLTDTDSGRTSQWSLLQLRLCCKATATALFLRLQHAVAVLAAAGLLVQVTRRSIPPPMPLQRLTLGFADAAIEE